MNEIKVVNFILYVGKNFLKSIFFIIYIFFRGKNEIYQHIQCSFDSPGFRAF